MDNEQERQLALIHEKVGEIIFISQQMEFDLIYSLTTLKQLKTTQVLDDGFDDSFRLFSKKTLGALIKKIGQHLAFTDDEIEATELALEERNYLVHKFYRDNIVKFTDGKGREECLQRLQEIMNNMAIGCKFCDAIAQVVMKMSGIDNEQTVAELKMKLGI